MARDPLVLSAPLLLALAGAAGGVSASIPAAVSVANLNGSNGFRIDGIDAFDNSGRSVASAGDINGDGVGDLVIGAIGANPGGDAYAGETYVVFGRMAAPANPFPASIDLSTLDGTNGFRINGSDAIDVSGFAVASAGDVNGDAISDLIIGAPGAQPGGDPFTGETYIVFGRQATTADPFPFPASLDLSTLDGTSGFRLDGIDADDRSGFSVASAGDVNGDTISDLIIGAPSADPDGDSSAGETYILFGPGCPGDVNGDGMVRGADLSVLLAQFGQSIQPWSDADLNGDGQVDGRDLAVLLSTFGDSC